MNEPTLAYFDYVRFQTLVEDRSGLHFPEKKRQDLASGVLRGMAESGFANLDDYYRVLSEPGSPASRAAFEQLVNFLTVGETHFFRDEAQFNALERQILPEIIARKRAEGVRRLRLWSAGCATGEEPYSLAMLVGGLLPDHAHWQISILATDINSQALKRAQTGIYTEWSFREVRARQAQRVYFEQLSNARAGSAPRHQLHTSIRERVAFAALNLVDDAYPALYNNTVAMDLIFCRNVLIYFQDETIRRVLARLTDCLIPEGWLVLGHADPGPALNDVLMRPRVLSGAVVYQKASDKQETPAWMSASAALAPPPVSVPVPMSFPAKAPTVALPVPVPEQDALAESAALLEAGQAAQAIDILEVYLHNHPNDARAHARMGEAYANLAHWTHARTACERAIALDPLQTSAYFVLGMVREHTGELDGAQDAFKRVVYLERDHILGHMALAGLHQRAGRTDAATRSLRNVIRLLETRAPESAVPGSGGMTNGRLLSVARELVRSLE